MNQNLFITAIRVPATGQFAATASRDFYMLHKLVYASFKDKQAATAARLLFRFDLEGEDGWLYVQSTEAPDWRHVTHGLKLQVYGPVPLDLPHGDRLRFRLLAKPSYRIGRKDSPHRGLRTTLCMEHEQREWLDRKAAGGGFVVEECTVLEQLWHDSKTNEQHRGAPKPLTCVRFDGILTVTDHEKLQQMVAQGIGPQKAYGFGLLSLAPL